jgi:hypothetical protein
MPTDLPIEPDLAERAPGECIARGQRRLLDLLGSLEWDVSFNYKDERSRT